MTVVIKSQKTAQFPKLHNFQQISGWKRQTG